MKKILLALAAVATIFAGCNKGLEDRVSNLENRVSEIEALLTELDVRVKGINTIVSDLQKNVYVTDVKPVEENGDVIGYTLTFTEGEPVTIYHGEKGDIGATGQAGSSLTIDWFDADGEGPEDGDWYWKYQGGNWLTDAEDNKIPAVKPLDFEIKEGVLWVKVGNVEEELGSVHGDSWFEDVVVDNEAGTVTIVIPGASQNLVLPFNPAAADEFALELQLPETSAVLGVSGSKKITIGYTILGCAADDAALFVYQLPDGWSAEVKEAAIELTITKNAGRIVLFAINNNSGEIRAKFIDIDTEKLLYLDVEKAAFDFPAVGGSVKFPVSTALDYKVIAPEWITPKKTTLTKGIVDYEYELVAQPNEGDALREGEVKFVNANNTEEVYFAFTVSQKNYVKELLGEYLESYTNNSGMTQRGTLKIELSDDPKAGTYKVTICDVTKYADYEDSKLYVHHGTRDRVLTVAEDFSKFTIDNFDFGSTTYSNYVAVRPQGAPELTQEEQALVGVYNETWTHTSGQPVLNGMEISASEEAAYGRLKIRFLVTNDGSAYAGYATLTNGKLTIPVGGQSHAKFGKIWNPDTVIELIVNSDGTLTMDSWKDGNSVQLTSYVATKYVEQGGGTTTTVTPQDLVGNWSESFTFGESETSDNMTIKLSDNLSKGNLKVKMFNGYNGAIECYAQLSDDGKTLTVYCAGLVFMGEALTQNMEMEVKDGGTRIIFNSTISGPWGMPIGYFTATKL